jgi:hypothetical protein
VGEGLRDTAVLTVHIKAGVMATAIKPHPTRWSGSTFYEIDPKSGATIDFFVGDVGWYWRERGSPDVPSGPFITSLDAYCAAMGLANSS